MKHKVNKIKFRFWSVLVRFSRNKSFYPYLYRSYWHYIFCPPQQEINTTCYYTALPNPGAGIGHQLANWNAGYWFAKQFGLKFAHLPFSNQKWEDFLGFGDDEKKVEELVKEGYKVRKLPLFNEYNSQEIVREKAIIQSYAGKKIIFLAEQDQFYKDQYGVIDDIKRKFYNTEARKNDQLFYAKNKYNIAIHIRRGDIAIRKHSKNLNLQMRWQNNDYFKTVLINVLKKINTEKPITVYLFSQGDKENFQEFDHFPNIHFCLNMDAQNSFLHMVYADLLITSKSSFSYKPALLNYGIKVCPQNFWHGYPNKEDWIMTDENGYFDKGIILK